MGNLQLPLETLPGHHRRANQPWQINANATITRRSQV
jgi:hypothetical protein